MDTCARAWSRAHYSRADVAALLYLFIKQGRGVRLESPALYTLHTTLLTRELVRVLPPSHHGATKDLEKGKNYRNII